MDCTSSPIGPRLVRGSWLGARALVAATTLALLAGCAAAPSQIETAPLPQYDGRRVESAAAMSPSALPEAPQPAAVPTDVRIGAHDVLDVSVLEASELNRTVRVTAAGKISVPLLGDVAVAGLTPREVELALEAGYRKGLIRTPHVSVTVKEMHGNTVSVVGAVQRPGVFPLYESRPLVEIIALAGGLTRESGATAVITRTTPSNGGAPVVTTSEVALDELYGAAGAGAPVVVLPGDLVKVRPAGVVYVLGEVKRPGAFPLDTRTGLTVVRAIALGEGTGNRAARSRTIVVRTLADGSRVEIPVDVTAVLNGKAPDVPLLASDVVFVPHSGVKAVTLGMVDGMLRVLTFRPGGF